MGSLAGIRGFRYVRQNHYLGESPLELSISSADANRQFSSVLRGVRDGTSYIVTSYGKPVARARRPE